MEGKLDLVCLMETWNKQSERLLFNELPLAMDYLIPHIPVEGVAGIIVLYNQQFKISPVVIPHFNSFECLVLSVSAPITTVIVTVYRPPKRKEDFMPDLLSMLFLKFVPLIRGDKTLTSMLTKTAVAKYFLS